MTVKEPEQPYRKTGIDLLGEAPWGTHLCLFYETEKDLTDILVPYFKTGLESNEFCMWVTSEPLSEEKAKEALREAIPDVNHYVQTGQIEIVPHNQWYLKDGVFDLQRVLRGWIDKIAQAISAGFDGIRVTGNTASLEAKDWKNFADYERQVNNVIGKYQIIAICTYSLDRCGASEIVDVVNSHQAAFIKRQGKWEAIESSEYKRAERIIRESEKLIAKGQLAAQVAHEINNPLAGIKNSFLLIKDAIAKDHPYYEYVGLIDKEIDRMSGIVRQIFDLYQPNEMTSKKFLIDDTVREVAASLEPCCRQQDVAIAINGGRDKTCVTLPENLLRQVIYNVLKNAIEASPPGAEVTVDIKCTEQVLKIAVSDQGPGISEQLRVKIFEPLFTNKQNKKEFGLGLGLSVSKNIVEAMGGSISFESSPGQGTVFNIIVPLDETKQGTQSE